MSKGVFLGAVIGGTVMFLWGAISHMLLPSCGLGMKALPEEDRILAVLKSSIPEPGVYVFPWDEPRTDMEHTETPALVDGPNGLLVYRPHGSWDVGARQPIVELLADIGCALVAGAALFASRSRLPSYARRAAFVAVLGLLPWLAITVSNWNWYHFPTPYLLADLVDQVVGFALTGLVLAATVKES